MKCPHCATTIHWKAEPKRLGFDKASRQYHALFAPCPACGKAIVYLQSFRVPDEGGTVEKDESLVFPRGATRPVPKEVPTEFAQDYTEACLVLPDSPKASAALSRRCLQHILHAKAGIKKRTLNDEIDEVLNSKQLPTHLAEDLDAIRHVGNFAAHPMKDTNTGAIVDVEPGEAEWLLGLLEGLFDFYFVQPAASARRRAALDAKLAAAGKQPMKVGS